MSKMTDEDFLLYVTRKGEGTIVELNSDEITRLYILAGLKPEEITLPFYGISRKTVKYLAEVARSRLSGRVC